MAQLLVPNQKSPCLVKMGGAGDDVDRVRHL